MNPLHLRLWEDLDEMEPVASESITVDMRGDGDQLKPCNAAGCHREQQRCTGYEKAQWHERCAHLRMEEFCLR